MTKQLIAAVSIIGVLATTASCRSTPPAVKTPQPAAASARPGAVRTAFDGSATAPSTRPRCSRPIVRPTTSVELAARGRQPGSWAVVLDADETVISNVQYQIERARAGLTFTPESWHAWIGRREATPIPGAAAFLCPRPRPRRPHRHRHEPAGVRVPGHRGGLQDAPPGVRHDALPSRRRTIGQEPALRGGYGRHHQSRRPAARRGGVCRRQHPGLPESQPGGSKEGRHRRSPRSGPDTSCCPTPCTAAGNSDDPAVHLRLPQVLLRRARRGPAELRLVDSRRRHARQRGRRALRRVLPELRRA